MPYPSLPELPKPLTPPKRDHELPVEEVFEKLWREYNTQEGNVAEKYYTQTGGLRTNGPEIFIIPMTKQERDGDLEMGGMGGFLHYLNSNQRTKYLFVERGDVFVRNSPVKRSEQAEYCAIGIIPRLKY